LLSRRASATAAFCGVGAAILARLLGAFAVSWQVATGLPGHLSAFNIAVAALACLVALWIAVVAVAMIVVLVREGMPGDGDEVAS
jgi:hypothetical protein